MKSLSVLPFFIAAVIHAEAPIAQWRFERGTTPGPPAPSEDVPARFLYDPLTKSASPNRSSAAFTVKDAKVEVILDLSNAGSQSLTFEAFVMPVDNKDAVIVSKTRATDAASELGLELNFQNGMTFHGGTFTAPGAVPVRWIAGYEGSSSQITRESQTWRHVALVYDQLAGTATVYVDYHLTGSVRIPKPLTWDAAPVVIGRNFRGLLDEVRITQGALTPPQFLRARSDALQGVTFTSIPSIAPKDSGCFDLRENFGAAGDGKTDDTAAINSAFRHLSSRPPNGVHTLLVPSGTYLISGPLDCPRTIDVKGAGPERAVLKLKDGVFTNVNSAQPMLRVTGSSLGLSRSDDGPAGSFYLSGLTFDTGNENPGAKAIEFHNSQTARLESVILRSGDNSGIAGIELGPRAKGPVLIQRANIAGFDYAIAAKSVELIVTIEHVALSQQRKAAILNQGGVLASRGLVSNNSCPALISEGPTAMATVLDSTLASPSRSSSDPVNSIFSQDSIAIRAEGGLYCRGIRTTGYKRAIERPDLSSGETPAQNVPGPNIVEYAGAGIVTGHGNLKGALRLPIEETPNPPMPPLSAWVNVQKYADKKAGEDWGPALQAAIDAGARLIYFPAGKSYEFATPVKVHGWVERLVGFGSHLRWAPTVWNNPPTAQANDSPNDSAPPPLLIFDEPVASRILILERLVCDHVQHAGRGSLVFRGVLPRKYSTALSGGKLFIEDSAGADWQFEHAQKVFARQWILEGTLAQPSIRSRGASIWALGWKTNASSPKLLAQAGAETELLGGLICPSGNILPNQALLESRNSALSLNYGTYVVTSDYVVQVRDVSEAGTREIKSTDLKRARNRGRQDLYISDGR